MRVSGLFGTLLMLASLQCISWSVFAHSDEHGREVSKHRADTKGGGASMRSMRDAVVWTTYPTLKIMAGGESRMRREVSLLPKNITPGRLDAYSANLKAADAHRELPYDLVTAKLEKSSTGGFVWLSAREEQADKVIVASTVYYMSERGSVNPTAMFMQQKNSLEIIPQPFPREHSRYRSNEDWKFLVRFNGRLLPNQAVSMVTQNGSKLLFKSDAHGVVTVRIPDDFSAMPESKLAQSHSHGRKSSEFVLVTEHQQAGKSYLTGFNGNYGADAYDGRSLIAGLSFMVLGMLGASPLLRHRPSAKQTRKSGAQSDKPNSSLEP